MLLIAAGRDAFEWSFSVDRVSILNGVQLLALDVSVFLLVC